VFEFIIAWIVALGFGIVSAVMGVGGGFFFVPTLTILFHLDLRTAMGTSLAVMIFTSLSASFWFSRQKKILYRIALVMIPPSVLFSILGSFVAHLTDTRILIFIFSCTMVMISLEMLVPAFRFLVEITRGPSFVLSIAVPVQGTQPITRIPYLHLIVWGAAGGFIGGITGTSGGVIFVPALATLGIPFTYAVATSMFTVIGIAMAGTATHAALDSLSLPFVAVYGTGAAVGACLGTVVATRVRDGHIRQIFGCLLLMMAVLLLASLII
jgi:hypothetical protein